MIMSRIQKVSVAFFYGCTFFVKLNNAASFINIFHTRAKKIKVDRKALDEYDDIRAAVQNNGNQFLGLHIYGQQLLSLISFVITVATIIFIKSVIEKEAVKSQ